MGLWAVRSRSPLEKGMGDRSVRREGQGQLTLEGPEKQKRGEVIQQKEANWWATWWSKQQAKKGGFSTMLFRRLERIGVMDTRATATAAKEGWWYQGPTFRFSLCCLTDKEALDMRDDAGRSPRNGKEPGCWSPARQLNQRWTACYFNSPLWGPPQTICAPGYTSNISSALFPMSPPGPGLQLLL